MAKPKHISYSNSKHFTSIVPPRQVCSLKFMQYLLATALEHSTFRGQNKIPQPPQPSSLEILISAGESEKLSLAWQGDKRI